nr:MAG TPA: hypothetical protein [Caudoviricetes sp.]
MHSYLYPPATLATASRLRFPTGTPSRLIYREPLDGASGIHSQNTIVHHHAPNHLLFLYIKVT